MAKQTFATVRARFSFDERTQRYRGPGGRFVPQREIKRVLNTVSRAARKDIGLLTSQLVSGEITIDQWQIAMAGAIKNLHLAQYAAGRGGFAALNSRDFGRIGAELRFQYDRLNNFGRQIEAGLVSPQAIGSRAEMYASAGNVSFERARRDGAEIAGMTEERRVLGNGEHCPDCLAYAELGWQSIGSLPEIGDSRCMVNCLCTFEYRRESES